MYRITVVNERVRRTIDLPTEQMKIVVQEASRDGWRVSYVLLPPDVELLPGILEEPVDLITH